MLVSVSVLLLLEAAYRLYLIDFYRPELEAHNPDLKIDERKQTILFLGDSFTGHHESFVSHLRRELGFSLNLVNGAVSGTGIIETELLAQDRIQEFNPDLMVYQIYLGNDLMDIKHRISGHSSLLRRFYYSLSDRLRVIKFINYRTGQMRSAVTWNDDSNYRASGNAFKEGNYSERQIRIFAEDPGILCSTLELRNGRQAEFERLISGVAAIKNNLGKNGQLILIIIPHCAQVSGVYEKRMVELGMNEMECETMRFVQEIRNNFPTVEIIDPLSEFQRLEREGMELYYQDDPHLSPIGQVELGKLVEPVLLEGLN